VCSLDPLSRRFQNCQGMPRLQKALVPIVVETSTKKCKILKSHKK
jgi:hypothetical protein